MSVSRFSGRRAAVIVALFALTVAAGAAEQHRLEGGDFARLRGPIANGAQVRVEHVPLVNDVPASLVLERFDVFAPDANIVVYGEGNTVLDRLSRPDVAYYRGHIEGDDDSLAFLSVSAKGRVEGFVFTGDHKFSIGSARRAHEVEVFVEESAPTDDILPDGAQFECDVEGAHLDFHPGRKLVSNLIDGAVQTDGALATGSAQWQLNLAIETDYELFVNSGSSAANVNTFIGNLVAAASTIYRREISTNLVVTYIGIQTSSADPFNVVPGQAGTWNGAAVTYTSSHALAELGDRWHNAATRPYTGARSSVVLVSGKPQMAGVAWIDTICEGDFACSGGNCGAVFDGHTGGGYAYCGGVDPPSDLSVPNPDALANYQVPAGNYWPLLQFVHELGHNVGSSHTHCIVLSSADAQLYGRTFVDQCVTAAGCYSGANVFVPAEKGTIMSYCHLRAGGGTNSRFVFGKSGEASHVVPEKLRSIVQSKTPTVSAITAPASLAQGASAAASVTGSGVSTYTWAITNGTINSGQGTAAINFTASATPVTLRVTATNASGCSLTDTKSVTVLAGTCNAPVISTQPASGSIVSGATRTLSVAATGTATLTYQWYIGASGVTTSPIARATTTSITAAPTVTTAYWVRVTNACGAANSSAATVTVTAPVSNRDAAMDFGGDGKSELMWRNSSTGQVAMWDMNGRTLLNTATFTTLADANWKMLGFGDFSGDKKDDVFFRNSVTGATAVWLMNGRTITLNTTSTPVADMNWQVHAIGDFNGDGKDELIWRNSATGAVAMWEMNGATLVNGATFYTLADQNWQIQLAADFTGDGKDELLWRNVVTGDLAMWDMNGRSPSNGAVFATLADLSWSIAGVGDYNGDGKADLLWRQSGTNMIAMWEMNGRTITNGASIQAVGSTWAVERSGDFNADGKAEIIFRNTSTGDVAMWEVNGHSLINTAVFTTVADLNWKIQPRGGIRPALNSQ